MKRIVAYLMLILLSINAFSEICFAQNAAMGYQVGDDQWSQEDDIYKNTVDISYGNKYFHYLVTQRGDLAFAWMQEPNNTQIILIIENNGMRYVRRNVDWIKPYIIPVEIGDNITFQFASMEKGNHTVWLAFPFQKAKVIRPPSKPKINQSQYVELLLGKALCISANSTDPGNDSINYSWDWGDGKIDLSEKNITKCHSWSEEGIYIINITASNHLGFNSSTINLTVLRPGQTPNKPKLNVSSDGFLWLGKTLCISANSTDPGNDSINYSWDWGDGKIDLSEKNITKCHSWSEEGIYIINITASNHLGFNSSTINLTVLRSGQMPNKPKLNVSSDGFLWLGKELCISANCADPGNDSINYSWDWGDGEIDLSGNNVTKCHSWSEEGTYVINITASNYLGFNSSKINLTVLDLRSPEILKNSHVGYVNTNYTYSIRLNTTTSIKKLVFLFNYSEGESIFRSEMSDNININHSWLSPGTKKIKARALDIQGNPGIWSEPINVDIYIPKKNNCKSESSE